MGTITLSKGLNLPFKEVADFSATKDIHPSKVAVDLSPYQYLHLKCTKKEGETILAGEALALDVHEPDRLYLSPFSGKILEVQRGERRRILSIAIELDKKDKDLAQKKKAAERQKKAFSLEELLKNGFSFYLHRRPFQQIIGKEDVPRSIFIHAISSAPFAPSYSHLLKDHEDLFGQGVDLLASFATVHLVHDEPCFERIQNVEHHQGFGPHPIENASLHIAAFDPITSKDDRVWSLDVVDVLHIGSLLVYGHPFQKTVVTLAGNGFLKEERVLVHTLQGACIQEIVGKRKNLIAGDPLTGELEKEYLRSKDRVITCFETKEKGEILSFLKLGLHKPTQTKTYLSGLLGRKNLSPRIGSFGEERPFIVKDIYQKYFPLKVYIEPLLKAMLAKDYELAIKLGLLEIDTPDFALCEYMCPSKIPLMEIFEKTKNEYLSSQ